MHKSNRNPYFSGTTKVDCTGPLSTVGNMYNYRCPSDCRSRGLEFSPGLVPFFVEIDHEIISKVIRLPSAESFKKGCCQLQVKVCALITC